MSVSSLPGDRTSVGRPGSHPTVDGHWASIVSTRHLDSSGDANASDFAPASHDHPSIVTDCMQRTRMCGSHDKTGSTLLHTHNMRHHDIELTIVDRACMGDMFMHDSMYNNHLSSTLQALNVTSAKRW